jgi:hypothetical protein
MDHVKARSFLFAPGNHERRAAKVFQSGADVAILDLEDAVAVDEKAAARDSVARALQVPRAGLGFVRVNGVDTPWCWGDLQTIVGPGLDGVMVPKAESAAQLQVLDWLLTQLERERGLVVGALPLLPIIETALGERQLEALAAASPRVRRFAFGGADYSLDLGLQWSTGEQEFECRETPIGQVLMADVIEGGGGHHLGEILELEDPHEWSSENEKGILVNLYHTNKLKDTKGIKDVALLLSKDDNKLSEAQVKSWIDNYKASLRKNQTGKETDPKDKDQE